VFRSDDPMWRDFDGDKPLTPGDDWAGIRGRGLKGALGIARATAIEQRKLGNIVGPVQRREVGPWEPVPE
jgi:hypothetical protein